MDPTTLLVASTLVSAGSSVLGGVAASKAASIERQQSKEAAEDRRIQALQEANQVREEADRVRRRNIALRAVSGLGLNSGSFLSVQSDVQRKAEDDIKNLEFQGASEARRFELSGEQAAIAGRSKLVGGAFGAGTTLLRGARTYVKGD